MSTMLLPPRHLLVRLLASAPGEGLRDGERAWTLGTALVKEESSLEHVVAVAMAAAESGRFSLALRWQEQGIAAVKRAGRQDLQPGLEVLRLLYKGGKPCRSPWPDDHPTLSPKPLKPPQEKHAWLNAGD